MKENLNPNLYVMLSHKIIVKNLGGRMERKTNWISSEESSAAFVYPTNAFWCLLCESGYEFEVSELNQIYDKFLREFTTNQVGQWVNQ